MRYAGGKLKTPCSTPSPKLKQTSAHLVVDLVGTPEPEKPSILAHLGKVVGRKQIAHDLGVSKSLIDQMIAGEKHDPVVRIRRMVRVAVKYFGPEPAIEIARDLIEEVNGTVLTAEMTEVLRQLLKQLAKAVTPGDENAG